MPLKDHGGCCSAEKGTPSYVEERCIMTRHTIHSSASAAHKCNTSNALEEILARLVHLLVELFREALNTCAIEQGLAIPKYI
ncbi:hypothetical protein EYF80_012703 [Liparis tanakae]|uniref:Uncharacterized protein n=1 Tax=Liparis tanakae TaxID=230148 RepID=A0A4Z2IH97_9TELE|nr:hypothetical protein EYF80_012703 [Liparis tanakae]